MREVVSSSKSESRRSWAVTFAGFCAFLGLYATQPLLPMLGKLFQVGKGTVSLTLTASTRWGRKRVIVGSASLLAVATLLNATAQGLPALIFWRFLQGIFTPGVFAVTVAYVQEEWAEGGAGRAMALYVTGTAIGGFTGRMLSGLIVSHWNWHWAFVALGVLGAASALVLQAWLPRERRFTGGAREGSLLAGMASHLRNPRLLATFAAGFCVLFSLVATFTYVTFHLAAEPFRLGPLAIGSLFCTYLVGALVTPPCGRIIDRCGHRVALAMAMGAGIGGLLLTLVPNLWAVVTGLALCCSGVFVAQAAANSYMGLAASHGKALAVGLYVTCYYIGGSVGSELPGFLWRFGGWSACVALVVLVQLLTIAITFTGWPAQGQEAAPDPELLPSLE
jgi:predicted MFS family arabinose efflux permease